VLGDNGVPVYLRWAIFLFSFSFPFMSLSSSQSSCLISSLLPSSSEEQKGVIFFSNFRL